MKESLKTDSTSSRSLDFATWLQTEFTSRCKRNPQYSLRSFAKLLGIDPSSLSQLMARKRKASSKMKMKVAKKLGATPEQLSLFQHKKVETLSHLDFEQMESDKFHLISDWYHISILELSRTKNFDSTPRLIAKRLGLKTDEVKAAIDRLKRLNLIKESKKSFVKTSENLSTFLPGQTSSAHKDYQKQVIEKAIDAVDEFPQEFKDITSISMAIDESKIPEARALIREFREKMAKFLESGEKTSVYNLNVQLYPVLKDNLK